ncbi:hypothetical protein Taro_007381 [Colocasia esculenta]|uniref:Uncharacterized protein n=1 Tax=Colocasia esculenta TaxID=4460 RepID=A0A843TYT1_COLES|nr:hypothetical protein [Colocasia esculenta]
MAATSNSMLGEASSSINTEREGAMSLEDVSLESASARTFCSRGTCRIGNPSSTAPLQLDLLPFLAQQASLQRIPLIPTSFLLKGWPATSGDGARSGKPPFAAKKLFLEVNPSSTAPLQLDLLPFLAQQASLQRIPLIPTSFLLKGWPATSGDGARSGKPPFVAKKLFLEVYGLSFEVGLRQEFPGLWKAHRRAEATLLGLLRAVCPARRARSTVATRACCQAPRQCHTEWGTSSSDGETRGNWEARSSNGLNRDPEKPNRGDSTGVSWTGGIRAWARRWGPVHQVHSPSIVASALVAFSAHAETSRDHVDLLPIWLVVDGQLKGSFLESWAVFIAAHVPSEVAALDQGFDLVLELAALRGVVVVVTMEATVLVLVVPAGCSVLGEGAWSTRRVPVAPAFLLITVETIFGRPLLVRLVALLCSAGGQALLACRVALGGGEKFGEGGGMLHP